MAHDFICVRFVCVKMQHVTFVYVQVLFDLLLRHFGEVTRCSVIPYKLLDGLTRHLYDLTQMSAQHAGRCIAELMADRYKEFTAEKEERRGKPRYPEFDLVCLVAYFPYLLITCSCDILNLVYVQFMTLVRLIKMNSLGFL